MSTLVNIDNYVHAETTLQFQRMMKMARGVNRFAHAKSAVRLDRQMATRMNRDTIYSSALVDISAGAALSFPGAGERYLSIQVIDEHHYTTGLYHGGGEIELSPDQHGSEFVAVIARIFANPADDADMDQVRALQAQLSISANAERTFERPDFDEASRLLTHGLLQQLGDGLTSAEFCSGSREEVHEARHLVTTAYGWGGLPTREVIYESDARPRPMGDYALTVGEVPVDAFWSLSVYDGDGYFHANPFDAYSINSVTAEQNVDGSVTLNFGSEPKGRPNFLFLPEGWNTVVRYYQPGQAIRDGSWRFPVPESV